MAVLIDGHDAVLRLATEDPQWLPAVRAALAVAGWSGDDFAGAWILTELQRMHASRTWYPNFRRLVTFGILEKAGDSTRGGQRAYYRMPDAAGVRRGLEEIERRRALASKERLSFTAVGRSGRSDLSADADRVLRSDFPDR
ncbi:MAG: hypothetical protein JOZ75_06865 [Candidatus Dormibacteraeota bacterium]|nr:hypothetical protein [Candidatus Dormibacteraeota bacterium]